MEDATRLEEMRRTRELEKTVRMEKIVERLGRAGQHSRAVMRALAKFFATNPVAFSIRPGNSEAGNVYLVSQVEPVPKGISVLVSDMLYNLRAALDYLAQRLVENAGGELSPETAFPIAASKEEYDALKTSRLDRVSPEVIAAIDAAGPYHGGNEYFWRLHKLNTIGRHPNIFLAGAASQSLDIGLFLDKERAKVCPDVGTGIQALNAYFRPGKTMLPLNVGDELFPNLPGGEPITDHDAMFRLNVAIGEAEVGEPFSIDDLLPHHYNPVRQIILDLRPYL